MNGRAYGFLAAAVAALMLILPLPALGLLAPAGSGTATTTAPTAEPATTAAASTTSLSGTTNAPSAGDPSDSFRVLEASTNNVMTIGERDFIIGCMAAEMYPSYHVEALKAQAVASYTYYSYQRSKARSGGDNPAKADFSDVPSTFPALFSEEGLRQRYGNSFDTYYAKLCAAADEVLGKRIMYDGAPILAMYHAISSDTTEDAGVIWGTSYPYLQPVPSPGDNLSPQCRSVAVFTPQQLADAVGEMSILTDGDAAGWIDPDSLTRSPAGTVTALQLCGTAVTGRELRKLLGLRSANFTIDYDAKTGFTFTVMGYGHGVGMSQCGADILARDGKSYVEILQYYYTGVTIE